MSATPIPRTLAIILYGDLQVSELRELPAGRLPIKNLAMPQAGRGKALRFILRQIAAGRQAYIICPAVEEGMMEELENVTDYTEKLRGALPAAIRIASLHGRMRPAEKDAVMEAFAAHETDILVSTTVVEVGINVPNATVMMVENAERYGLSQLHQLRGRVGRGKEQSYCIFLYAGDGEKPERLQVLEKNNDGFKIAEEDLKLRGPGDIFGTRQSGERGFVMADIYHDANVMKEAAAYVDTVLARNPDFALTLTKSVDFRSI
jgi:ATP-dependent DNA helicase RecG